MLFLQFNLHSTAINKVELILIKQISFWINIVSIIQNRNLYLAIVFVECMMDDIVFPHFEALYEPE